MRRFIENCQADVHEDLARLDLEEEISMGIRRSAKYQSQLV